MSDRRGDKGFRLTEAAKVTVRMYPEVIVRPHGDDEWIAIGREAAVVGEMLILGIVLLEMKNGDLPQGLPLCVIESHPIIIEGDLRHWIRLRRDMLAPILFE